MTIMKMAVRFWEDQRSEEEKGKRDTTKTSEHRHLWPSIQLEPSGRK